VEQCVCREGRRAWALRGQRADLQTGFAKRARIAPASGPELENARAGPFP
jgi:hypothetical protein